MKLHLVSCGLWTVLAVCADEERCDVRDLAKGLRRDDPREYARLMRAFAHGIFELKTRGGVRVLYFFDEGRVVVWSGASLWPSSAPLARGGAISTTGAAAPCGSWRISD